MQKYFHIIFFTLLVVCGLVTPAIATESTFSTRIATVDVRFLLKNSPQSNIATEQLKKRFQHREKELESEIASIQQLDNELRQMTPDLSQDEIIQRKRELRDKRRSHSRVVEDYREDLRLARNTALEDVQKTVFEAIDDVREKEGIDVVIQDYVSASKRSSITDKVLIHLQMLLEESKVE